LVARVVLVSEAKARAMAVIMNLVEIIMLRGLDYFGVARSVCRLDDLLFCEPKVIVLKKKHNKQGRAGPSLAFVSTSAVLQLQK
jgi:hypothetical protein